MRRPLIGLLLVTVSLVLCRPTVAAPPASEAYGEVVDQDGNPLQGAVVTFTPKANPAMGYKGKSSKRGRYFVSGMFASQGDEWQVMVELEGYVPTQMVVESRTVNRVLIGDVFTKKLNPGGGPWEVVIRPLGKAKVDFTLTREDLIQKVVEVAQAPAAAAPEAQQPQRDPWDEALRLAADGDLAGSVPLFEKAVEKEPEAAERRTAMAKVLYQLERLDEAEAQAEAAIEMAPEEIDGRMVLYSIHVAKGDLDGAKAALEEARRIAPDDVRVLKQLAFVAGEAGNTADAVEAYEGVTEVEPEDTEAWMALGDLYARTGQLDKSEAAYQRVVELDPANAHQIFFNLGALIINKPNRSDADTRKAIQAFRRAVEIKPDYSQAHKQLAFALLGVGDRAGAKSALEQYVKLSPDAPDAARMRNLIASLGG